MGSGAPGKPLPLRWPKNRCTVGVHAPEGLITVSPSRQICPARPPSNNFIFRSPDVLYANFSFSRWA
ncbi:hypothetical protein CUJ84_pRLN1000968 (plasmid) [Rhizobium leguminosarum]|uniref:Uncharacterized protein n=1 Tax=Rhizobium leguminosarum TaxID=384 RepID=A0A2K9ZDV4_RHILE|nr:hypothetical protein CUJ84_pRLN1000968 [Rhizobium leguminosarum]